ncbi:MAG: hypothetical protein IT176_10935 [Acidobacteria bacterium]|nr:hypothetical protein [Acidobacteriota bacterium]
MKVRMILIAGLLVVTWGCGSRASAPAGPSPAPAPAPGGSGSPVSIPSGASFLTRAAYAPNPVVIAPGGRVTWTNNDTTSHTSTSDTGTWNSGGIAPGQSFSRAFPSAGSFAYHCAFHPGMIGVVIVQ